MKFSKFKSVLDKDLFAPWFIFPIVYVLYFTFGSLDITTLPNPTLKSNMLVIIGLLCYLFGSYISLIIYNKYFNYNTYENRSIELITKIIILVSIIGSFLAIINYLIAGNIPLLDPSLRSELTPRFFALILFLPISMGFILIYVLDEYKNGFKKNLFIVLILLLGTGATFFTAYRSPILIFLLTFIVIINYKFIKFSLFNIFISSILIGIMIVGIQQYRIKSIYNSSSFDYINPMGYPNAIVAAYMPCHEGVIVFSDIVKISPITGLFHGEIFRMIFATLLPGIQMGPRGFVSLLRETDLSSSTTPSILGGPYLDFGIIGLMAFMIIIGLIITLLYKFLLRSNASNFSNTINTISYSYTLAVLILSIHTGLLDVVIILFLLFILFIQSLANKWFDRKSVLLCWILVISVILLSLIISVLIPTISNEESAAIHYCDLELTIGEKVAVDTYIARTAITSIDNKYMTAYSILDEFEPEGNKVEYFLISKYINAPYSGGKYGLSTKNTSVFYDNQYVRLYHTF